MGSDYERWKKRRDAERARREKEREAEPARRPTPSPARPVGGQEAESPRRGYQGYIPPAPPPSRKPVKKRGDTLRGCLGCLGLLLGALLLLAVLGAVVGTFYWRQIEQRGKINMLILGIDERPTESPPFRSDTMILAGFNPQQREVALMSIPRDLWLPIPGHQTNRINTAHYFGGPALAKETVATSFGIPLHYYVKINFGGFVGIIDAMGGITLDVPEPLHDENYPTADYGTTTIDIPAGLQEMDGETALIYARSRYSTSDFDRARRQQEVIVAMKNKLLQPATWLKAPAILAAVNSAVESDMSLAEWPALAMILFRSNIERATIGPEDTTNFVTDGGAQVLLPVWERINPILARYFE